MYVNGHQKKYTIYSFFIEYLKPFRWQTIGLFLVGCYWALHVSLQPYVIKLIIDHVSTDPSIANLTTPALFYILLAFGFTLNFRIYDYLCLNFYPQLKANIFADGINKISHYSYGFFQHQFAGSLSDKIKNLGKGAQEMLEIFIERFFSQFLAIIIGSIVLATVHPFLSIILITWTIMLIIIGIKSTQKARLLSHELSDAFSTIFGFAVDRLSNILNVKLFNGYNYEKQQLNKKLSTTVSKDKKIRWFLLKIMLIQGLASAAMLSASLLVLIFFVQSKNITIGDFALVITLSLSFAEFIFLLAQEVTKFTEVYGMVSQGIALLNQDIEIKDAANASTLVVTQGEIKFDQVHFQYPNISPLFSNKSITLLGGQKVGLVGFSGSGKSTFVNLILRLYEINDGKILIDNQDIKKVTQASLHQSISMIPQDPILFHRSLMENICYGLFDVNADKTQQLEQVITAAKKAHAHEFIENLPLGYDTLVGERGIKLSGGQKQRIAIARAILKNAPILLMDEATSSLDSATESIIGETLTELMRGKTTVIIAHRLSTLLNMDRILVFDNGKIVEDGSHQELLDQNGQYKILWDAQIGGFIPDRPQDNNGNRSRGGSPHVND